MKYRERGIYHFFITLPDHVYPWSTLVSGKRVRGVRAYNHALTLAFQKNGYGHYGVKLTLYRSFFHLLGSLALIAVAVLASSAIFGTDEGFYAVLTALGSFMTYQEFYLQRRWYRQPWVKGILDWCVWLAPFMAYAILYS